MKNTIFKFIFLIVGILCIVMIVPYTGYAESPIWAPDSLKQLINEAMSGNNMIKGLEAQVEGLKEEAHYAGALPDPRLEIGVLNLPTGSYKFDEQAMTQKQIVIAQKFLWFGKLNLMSRQVVLKAEMKQAVLDATKLDLAQKIAVAYYDLGFISKSMDINDRLIRMMKQITQVAETRYSTGKGFRQDIFQAQVELGKMVDESINLKKKYRLMEDKINELMNSEQFMSISPPVELTYPGLKLDVEILKSQALKENPYVRADIFNVTQAKDGIKLAGKGYWPDMDVKVAYGQRDEVMGTALDDFLSASVMINLPLWQHKRQDKKKAAIMKNHEAAVNSYKNTIQSLPYQIDALVTEINENQRGYRHFVKTLNIQAEQWATSALADYGVGKVEFNTMINAQIRQLQFELKAEKYLYTIYKKRAELETVIGGMIDNHSNWKENNDE